MQEGRVRYGQRIKHERQNHKAKVQRSENTQRGLMTIYGGHRGSIWEKRDTRGTESETERPPSGDLTWSQKVRCLNFPGKPRYSNAPSPFSEMKSTSYRRPPPLTAKAKRWARKARADVPEDMARMVSQVRQAGEESQSAACRSSVAQLEHITGSSAEEEDKM